MIAPEPSIEPAFAIESKSYGRSRYSSVPGSTGELEPPGKKNLIPRPSGRAAGEVVDDLARRDAELDLEVAGALDVAETETTFVPVDLACRSWRTPRRPSAG